MKRIAQIMYMAVFALLLAIPAFAGGGRDVTPAPPPGTGTALDFVACFNPGGGHDFLIRNMELAIRTNNLTPNSVNFLYRPGGNMAVGMTYTRNQRGRSDIIMAATNQLIAVPIQMDTGVRRQDLTDLAIFGDEFHFFWVMADSEFMTFDDLLRANRPITFTSPGAGSFEEITIEFLQSQHPEADFRIVHTPGSDAESMTLLLGGHVDVFINELAGGGMENYLAAGYLRGLVNLGPRRSYWQPEIPTLMELGYDFALSGFRGVMGPPDMSPEAIAWWEDLFYRMFHTPQFQEYIRVQGLEPNLILTDRLTEWFDDYTRNLISIFRSIGIPLVANPYP